MKILAIDPGTNELGLYDGERAATLSVSKKKMVRSERLAELGVKLVDFMFEHGPYDFVVYEEQFCRGDGATRALYGMIGVIECSAVNSGAGAMPIPQATIRKWAHEKLQEMAGMPMSRPKNREEWKARLETLAISLKPHTLDLTTQDEHDAACIYFFFEQKGIKD